MPSRKASGSQEPPLPHTEVPASMKPVSHRSPSPAAASCPSVRLQAPKGGGTGPVCHLCAPPPPDPGECRPRVHGGRGSHWETGGTGGLILTRRRGGARGSRPASQGRRGLCRQEGKLLAFRTPQTQRPARSPHRLCERKTKLRGI